MLTFLSQFIFLNDFDQHAFAKDAFSYIVLQLGLGELSINSDYFFQKNQIKNQELSSLTYPYSTCELLHFEQNILKTDTVFMMVPPFRICTGAFMASISFFFIIFIG